MRMYSYYVKPQRKKNIECLVGVTAYSKCWEELNGPAVCSAGGKVTLFISGTETGDTTSVMLL